MKSSKRAGLTLPELLMACFVLGILSTAIAAVFHSSVAASAKSLDRNELLSELTIMVRTFQRDLQQTNANSVSIGTNEDSVAFLTHYDDQGSPQINPEGRALWQAYKIYYHDPAEDILYRRRIPLQPTSVQRDFPSIIDLFDPGLGVEPHDFYLTDGQPAVRHLETLQLTLDPSWAKHLDVSMDFLRPGDGNKVDSRSHFECRVFFRN